MKNRCLLFSFLVILGTVNAHSQRPDTLWMKYFGGTGGDGYLNAFLDKDDNVCIGGYLYKDSHRIHYLIKADQHGDTLWTANYRLGDDPPSPSAMIMTADSGFLFGGIMDGIEPYTLNSDIHLLKLDKDHNIEWERRVGMNEIDEGVTEIAQRKEGGYLIVGDEWRSGTGWDMVTFKVSSAGIEESRRYYDFGEGLAERSTDLIMTADSGFVLAGYCQDINSSYADNTFLMKLDPSGDSLWTGIYGLPYPKDENPRSVFQASDSGYVVAGVQKEGTIYLDCEVFKTDKSGNQQWVHHYGGTYNDGANDVIQTSDGGFAACGSYYKANWKALVIRYDAGGDTLWTYHWGDDSRSLYAYKILQLSGGDFLVVGTTSTEDRGVDIFLARVHENPVGIEESFQESSDKIIIFPSPADEFVYIQTLSEWKTAGSVSIYDLSGKLILKYPLEKAGCKELLKLDISNIQGGIYILKVESENKHWINKLIIK